MRDPQQMMIDAQGKHINDLRQTNKELAARVQSLERELATAQDRAMFYKLIEDCCFDNPVVASEWKRFAGILRLSLPDDLAGKDIHSIAHEMAKRADRISNT